MSSHREAPAISKDPSADNTDVYAWVDQTDPTMVNLVANFNPFELPYGGPNFSEFSDEVLYAINVSNLGTGLPDISYQFAFNTVIRNPNTFLYNVGPITSATDPNWNRPQTYTVAKLVKTGGKVVRTRLASGLTVPPVNVGERSTPNYDSTFTDAAVHALPGGGRVFCGPRADAFFVDLGSIFDLAGLRPLNNAHAIPLPVMQGMNGLQGLNCHTIALQIPITDLTGSGTKPSDPTSSDAVIGVYAAAYRAKSRVFDSATGTYKNMGTAVQVSRLGNPLFNEVLNPMSVKDKWNSTPPSGDSGYAKYVNRPELAQLLPVLYSGAFPNLAAFNASMDPRTDLHAIFLTGIPASVLGGAFTTYTGATEADMLRLNVSVPPTAVGSENNLGVLYGDNAGFPNGRRPLDDVTTIELRALAGKSIKLTYPDYVQDSILNGDAVRDGTSNTNPPLKTTFPYLAAPNSGYLVTPPTADNGTSD